MDSDISIASSGEEDNDDDGIVFEFPGDIHRHDEESIANEEDDPVDDQQDPVDDQQGQDSINIIVVMICKLIMYWHIVYGLSESVLRGLLLIFSKMLAEIAKLHTSLEYMSKAFPSSVYRFRKLLGIERDIFRKYVMCPKCGTLYPYGNIIGGGSWLTECKEYWVTAVLPNRRIQTCRAKLVKEVWMANRKVKIYPLKTFCYNSLIDVLKVMIKRNSFLRKCNDWKTRVSPSGYMTDIYDGNIWQSFFGEGGKFQGENYLGFLLNVDWFQPYKHRSVSIGAIYLTCLNLPREERYKKENIIVVGIIPSMADGGEPSSINSILKPLVEDFQRLFVGVDFETSENETKTCYGLLVGCSSDIPANRKLCGFLSHAAIKGCSRCFKQFKSFLTNRHKRNYSGFNKLAWNRLKRSGEDHRDQVKGIRKINGTVAQKKEELERGLRYSSLLDLPYFDPVRFCLIDPMHNLFLGTAKRMFILWLDLDILNTNILNTIKLKIENVKIPSDIGRIPSNIASNHSRFTAEEWKNWTLYYSPFVLRDIIHDKHYKCWQKFVLACTFLCKPFITKDEVQKADTLFFNFGAEVQKLYGLEVITPNMHMHGHLADCVYDYGPVQAFWCFAFERFNGTLSQIPSNHRSIELQLMRTIISWSSLNTEDDDDLYNCITPTEVAPNFHHQTISLIPSFEGPISTTQIQNLSTIKLCGKQTQYVLTEDESNFLEQMYSVLYIGNRINHTGCMICSSHIGITVGRERFGSKFNQRSTRSAHIVAAWCADDGSILNSARTNARHFRPGQIKCLLTHSVEINNQIHTHVLAYVNWYERTHDLTNLFQNTTAPVSTWKETFTTAGPASFIPVQRIYSKCAIVANKSKRVVYACPLQRRF